MYTAIMNINFIADIVKDTLSAESSILAVFLLGSAARNELRKDSDIDLALMLYPGTSVNCLNKLEIAGKLSCKLGRTIDPGEISVKNPVYSREALLKGTVIFDRDSNLTNLIRANLLGLYIQFNIDRREVLDAYTAG